MLALLIALCLATALIATWLAARKRRLPPALLVLTAVLMPLACFAYLQTQARPTRSALAFEVLGQFHSLGQMLTFSDESSADVVLGERAAAAVTLRYEPDSQAYTVRVLRSAEPVFWGQQVINGRALERSNTIGAPRTANVLEVTRPWWCQLRCAQYTVRGPAGLVEVDLADSSAVLQLGGRTLTLSRVGRQSIVSADPRAGVRVNGQPIPDRSTAPGDTLRIGNLAYGIQTRAQQHRVDVLFGRNGGRERWDLPADLEPDARFLVAASATDTVPGIVYVLNPAAVAPGAARAPYGGFIERQGSEWSWRASGSSQAQRIELDQPLLLPGQQDTRTSGHIVMLQQRDTQPGSALLAVTLAWLLGAALLAFLWRSLSGAPLAFRVATIGCLYTLIMIRSALAFRAWLAPPHNVRVIVVLLSLLIAFPALIASYHYWEGVADRGRARGRGSVALVLERLRGAWPTLAFVLVAFLSVLPLVLPSWYGGIIVNVAAIVGIGSIGLAALQRLLIAPHLLPALHGPLAVLDEKAARDYTYRQFITAVAALAFVGGLFALVTGAIQYGRLLAIAATAFVALALVWLDATFAPFARPTRRYLRILFAVVGGSTFGVGAYLAFNPWVALGAAAAGVYIGWIAVERPRPRIRPFALREAIRPGLLAAAAGVLIVLISTGLLNRVRVLVGYALAVAGMIVIVRIFTILWFRESDQARRISTRQPATVPHRLPSILALAVVLVLALAVYVPLGVTDPGLVLLFFLAATVPAVIGLATVGWRGAGLGLGMLTVVVSVFFVMMNVRVRTLQREQPVTLTTAQTRYAAALHPDALQQHLVVASVPAARQILNTLQQDWGMQYYSALGGTGGRGYFGADFLDRGVTTPVALAENSYAVFVLSEHGWLGGVAVLWVYLALVVVLLVAAAFACDQAAFVPRALLLTGVAAFWTLPTLYMVAANASLLPLTGQNVPWLGLLSPADAALGAILGALALHALPRAVRGKPGRALPMETRLRGVRKGIGYTILATLALGGVVTFALWRPLHAAPDDFRLNSFLARIDELVHNRAILPGDSIAVAASARTLPAFAPGTFLTRTLRASNALARGERANTGYCYARDALLRVTSARELSVMHGFCGLGSSTGSRYAWRGNLLAGSGGDDLLLTDGRTTVVFAQNASGGAVVGGAGKCDVGLVRASSARIGCQRAGALVRFGSSALTFEPQGDTESVLLNAKAANGVTLLQPGDVIASPDGTRFLVTRVPHGAAAYARWENGAWRRVTSPSAGAWLQQLDGQLARTLNTRAGEPPNAVLTLQPALHEDLRAALRTTCARVAGATACSALIADPTTGAILAFAEWQNQPVASPRFRAVDANLRNHPPASAIKPIVGAAALHAYPRLRELEIDHNTNRYTTVANLAIGDTLRATRLYPNRRVPWTGFLGASDNLYAATLGLLAAAPRGRNGLPEMRGNADASGLTVQGTALRGSPVRKGVDRSPLARALEELYGVQAVGTPEQPHEARFWTAATDAGALRRSDDLQRISPEAVSLELDRLDNPRTLASFMIGGASNRWNNVALVQALSRLYTGRNVELHLLQSIGERQLPRAPEPVPALQRVQPHIRDGLHATIHEPWGTAYTALHNAFNTARVSWIGKTGTLAEPEWTGSVFLWTGEAAHPESTVCPTAGIIVIELRRGAGPEGKATASFRDRIAPLLKEHRGWGTQPCAWASR